MPRGDLPTWRKRSDPSVVTNENGEMAQREWNLEVFATDSGIEPFSIFADELEDFEWVALDAALRAVLAVRGLDLVRTEWLKSLGQGLHEFRIRHDADEIANMFGGGPRAERGPRHVISVARLRAFPRRPSDPSTLRLRQGRRPERAAPATRDRRRTSAPHRVAPARGATRGRGTKASSLRPDARSRSRLTYYG